MGGQGGRRLFSSSFIPIGLGPAAGATKSFRLVKKSLGGKVPSSGGNLGRTNVGERTEGTKCQVPLALGSYGASRERNSLGEALSHQKGLFSLNFKLLKKLLKV